MKTRLLTGIPGVFLFLFLAGCQTYPTGGSGPRVGAGGYVFDNSTGYAVVPEHEHRCPVCGLTWTHRKKSCAAPVEYACKEHKSTRP